DGLPVQAGVMGDVVLRPDGEFQPTRQIEEGDRAMRELATDNAFGREAEAVTIEGKRSFEIGNAEREDGDLRFHGSYPSYRPLHHADAPIVLGRYQCNGRTRRCGGRASRPAPNLFQTGN